MIAILRSTLLLICMSTAAAAATSNAVARRWMTSSRLTPADAIGVLVRESSGEAFSSEELFEAEKHLRSDGPVSPSEYVLNEIFRRELSRELESSDRGLLVRLERPVLHWLETRTVADGVELRGESLQLAVVRNATADSMIWLRHRTLHQVWSDCGGELCMSTILEPLRSDVAYLWSIDSRAPRRIAACAPEASEHGPMPDAPTILRCLLPATPSASLRLSYTAAGSLAVAPPRAAASAIINNPALVQLFQ